MAKGEREGQSTGEHTRAYDVFISYASQDAAVANGVVAGLERSNLNCWIAPRDVAPGEFYAGAIVRAIDAVQVTVLILSGNAAASPHVLREVERAASNRHPVIAMRIDHASMPAELEYFLNSSQWLDATGCDVTDAIPRLIAAVRLAIDRAAIPAVVIAAASSARLLAPAPSTDRPWPRAAIAVGFLAAVAIAAFAAFRIWQPSRSSVVPAATSEAGAAPPATYAAATIPEKSVAVLPFVDMSEKKDQQYFADGLTDELIDLLSRGSDIKIPARTSSFYFQGKQATVAEIAKALGVAHVLEGSIRKVGNTMRITVQFIRAADGYHMWSSSYDRDIKDVFKVQDEIAAAAVSVLKAKLANSPVAPEVRRTASAEAYDQYLIGRQFTARRTAGDYERAVVAFQRAITLDPTFAAAYAGLSEAQYLIATDRNELTMGEFGRIQAQLRRAIELGPDLSEAYSERGIERLEYPADFAGAQADLARAIAIEPSSSTNQRRYGFLLRCLGRVQEAIIYGRRATDTDPLDSFAWLHLGESLLASGQYDQARNAFTKIVEINPEDPDGLPTQFNVSLLQGRGEEVLGSVAKLADPTWRLYYTAMAESTLGHDQDSLRALNELLASGATTPTLSARIADVYAWRGDNQQALAWLDKAGAQNKGAVGCVNTNPLYRRLRGDPRFEAFLRNMGLAKY